MGKLTKEQIAMVLYNVDVAFSGVESPPFEEADADQCIAAVDLIAEGKDVVLDDERRAAVMRAVVETLGIIETTDEVQLVLVNVPTEGMVGVQYIGSKPRHIDNLYGTGLEWEPGDVYNVDKAIASKMEKHPDVYAIVEAVAGAGCASPVKIDSETEDENPQLPRLDGMDKNELIDYAQRHFGENFAKNMKPENMRAKILGLIQSGRMISG